MSDGKRCYIHGNHLLMLKKEEPSILRKCIIIKALPKKTVLFIFDYYNSTIEKEKVKMGFQQTVN